MLSFASVRDKLIENISKNKSKAIINLYDFYDGHPCKKERISSALGEAFILAVQKDNILTVNILLELKIISPYHKGIALIKAAEHEFECITRLLLMQQDIDLFFKRAALERALENDFFRAAALIKKSLPADLQVRPYAPTYIAFKNSSPPLKEQKKREPTPHRRKPKPQETSLIEKLFDKMKLF